MTVPLNTAPADELIVPAVIIEPDAFKAVVAFEEMSGLNTLILTLPDIEDGLNVAVVKVPDTLTSSAKILPKNDAPPEEDIVPETVKEESFVKVTVSPITTGPEEDNVPFVIVTAPWLIKEPVKVVPAWDFKVWNPPSAELETAPVTVNAPAAMILRETCTVLAITVPRNTAPADEDMSP